MAEIKFSQLTTAAQLTNDDIFALAQMQGGSLSSVKTSMIAVANFLNTQVQYTTAYNTQAKTTAGAINELKQLISLIPQFSIEVFEELPTEDISDTTIYLVPAEDPEVGNYYEEYIHVNNTWELVGTTAVDLSAYYTKLEVDGLLATKASVADLALKENKSDMPTDVRTIIKDCKTPKSATITNGIAQFECIEENLVKGLKVTMNPIQDLHGYDYPWAGGAGKNKLQNTASSSTIVNVALTVNNDGSVAFNGTANNAFNAQYIGYFTLPSGSYIFTDGATTSNYYFYLLKEGDATWYKNGDTFTVDGNTRTRVILYIANSAVCNSTLYPMIRLSTVTDATFAPYSNICPISGRTEASVTRTGKNKAPINDFTVTRGTVETFSPNLPSGTYSISFNSTRTGSDSRASSCRLIYDDDTNYEFSFSPSGSVKKENITLAKPVKSIYMYSIGGSYSDSGNFTLTISNFQIETGSQATAYEPYITPETHTHQYGQTVYGGEDDFVNGGLSNEWGYIASYDGETLPGEWLSDRDVYAPDTTPTTGAEVAYKLSTPTTIQTSAEEITTVEGTNIISGTEPISECKYTELATVDDLRKIIGGQ